MAGHGTQTLPESGALHAVQARLLKDRLTLLLDTSGEALHKRGYRKEGGPAPLRETLAAALIRLCRWHPDRPLADPFCGSGTIPIEAALMARNQAPGLHRAFDAQGWGSLPGEIWEQAREDAFAQIRAEIEPPSIAGYDLAPEALVASRRNAERAGVRDLIHFQQRAFEDFRAKGDYGWVITNPPYGVRLEDRAEATALLRTMPGVFRRLATWSFGVLTDHEGFEGLIGQEATKRRKLYNGSVECTFYRFDGPKRPRPEQRGQESSAQARPQAEAPQAAFGALREADQHRLDEFEVVFAKRLRHFRKWPQRGIEAYRLYDRDVPALPVVIDRYGSALHIACFETQDQRSLAQREELIEQLVERAARVAEVPRSEVFLKTRRRQVGRRAPDQTDQPDTQQAGQYERVDDRGAWREVQENGLRLRVNLSDYLDTGLFLDHRLTRAWVRQRAAGKRVLNLFCYTGSFTVAAAAGGGSTVSVDLSNTYLDWARENLRLNGLESDRHRLVRADVQVALQRARNSGERFDLIIADPPTFSNSKGALSDWDVQRDHPALLVMLLDLLAEDGTILFSTNHRRFEFRPGSLGGAVVTETTARFCPEDFRKRPAHRSWLVSRGEGGDRGD